MTLNRLITMLPTMRYFWLGGLALTATVAACTVGGLFGGKRISYNEQIRPIVNAKCITCHGGIKKSGNFSMLFREEALAKAKSGKYAIVPGDADASELVKRLVSDDPELRMPLEHPPLSKDEINLIRDWIDQGAEWEDHWAYLPPKRGTDATTKSIDTFVRERLEQEGLKPAPEADRATLLRRVSLDLTGLPPTHQQATRFLRDTSPNAYEKLVDTLLASPRFGERWASMWLDLARYADSKGYEKDLERSIWTYRDWVIDAFNRDLPFDRFTLEQLAGDLLPATDAATYQRNLIATAFHRNTMANDEGGTNDEEFRNMALIDRVSTTFEVWQGTTMSCVQCHSHPYDPIRHADFYKFLAFFNNTEDRDIYNEKPKLSTFTPDNEQYLRRLMGWIRQRVPAEVATLPSDPLTGLGEQRSELLSRVGYRRIEAEDFDSTSRHIELWDNQTAIMQTTEGAFVGYDNVDLTGVSAITYRYTTSFSSFIELHLDRPDGPLISRTKIPATQDGAPGQWYNWKTYGTHRATVQPTSGLTRPGRHTVFLVFRKDKEFRSDLVHIDWFHLDVPQAPISRNPALRDSVERLTSIPAITTPVMRERPAHRARQAHVFIRGNWLTKGQPVQPDVPRTIGNVADKTMQTRLDMARWLVSRENPLTARVMVNRFWEQLFGYGLVETLEDFGTMGGRPSHPELLDALAVRFQDTYRWSMKKLLRELVLSATYRQSALVSKDLQERDPRNRLLARGPRVRLSAEQIRDQALAVSGLLNPAIGGPSVRPFNPTNDGWKNEKPESRHRRALYTFWQRTNPYPSMVTFDSPQRNLCVSRRIRTNTPLQALTTLNDTVYVEAAQHLARYMQRRGRTLPEQISAGYQRILFRQPSPAKLMLLKQLYAEATITTDKKGLTLVANAILNLDETLTK